MYLSCDFFFSFFFSLSSLDNPRLTKSQTPPKKEKEKVNSVQRETSLRTAACLFFAEDKGALSEGAWAREIKAICERGSAGLFLFDARFLFLVLHYKGENG